MSTATAETIIEQLGRSTGNMARMIGAHTFTAGEHSLTFKFKAKAENGSNCVRITLGACDTYRVEFIRLRGVDFWHKGEFSYIGADGLRPLFEKETGLYLSL